MRARDEDEQHGCRAAHQVPCLTTELGHFREDCATWIGQTNNIKRVNVGPAIVQPRVSVFKDELYNLYDCPLFHGLTAVAVIYKASENMTAGNEDSFSSGTDDKGLAGWRPVTSRGGREGPWSGQKL